MDARKVAIGLHLFIAGWMFINALGHEAHVLWKWNRGSLRPGLEVAPLLWLGAGLLAVAIAFALSAGPLMSTPASFWPAYVALAVFVAVIAAIAKAYGFKFLFGSITLATLELAAISTYALKA